MTKLAPVKTELLTPANDILEPEFTILIPALNEELTIAEFVDWCFEGLKKANVKGEVLIVDSSTDRTSEIALSKGARVLRTPKRGLGQAYIDALPFARGKYLLLGDCDLTYDFRELNDFVARFREGSEYIMGSRFTGYIEDGAMPPLHRYFGTPITTKLLNFMYGSHFTDIHCGMRGISLAAFKRMNLQSGGWEYASEMVLKSVRMKLVTSEVPIRFYKDREGRLSHHKRSGWFSPWYAGWINLRAMFIYGPEFFLLKPGILLLVLGQLLLWPLMTGPLKIGPISFSLYWMLLGLFLSVLGSNSVYLSMIGQALLDFNGETTRKLAKIFDYTKSTIASAMIFLAGMICEMPLLKTYVESEFTLNLENTFQNHLSIFGFFLMSLGFMNFTFTLLLHAVRLQMSTIREKSK